METTLPEKPTDPSALIRQMGRHLHAAAGAFRRRGLWLVFGALGGLIGGIIVAMNATPTVIPGRYYKATATLRLQSPATTATAVDTTRWSLQLAQMATMSDAYRQSVATEIGQSKSFIQGHLITVAYNDTATIEMTVVATDPEIAVQAAYHAATALNDAIAADMSERFNNRNSTLVSSIYSTHKLVAALEAQLETATGADRARIQSALTTANAQSRTLRDQRRGVTITPPVFVLSARPEAVRINANAYYSRWMLARNDIGLPRVLASSNLVNSASQDPTVQQQIAQAIMSETKLPDTKRPSPVQPISLGLLAGLVMGISAVMLGEAWDERVHDSLGATAVTGMNVIVEIPRLTRRRVRALLDLDAGRRDTRLADAQLRYQEAAWVIATALGIDPRTSVDASPNTPHRGPAPMVLVTSTSPAEGKTTSTAALAGALAALGFDVLAVDGDYHHRSLRKLLKPIPSFVDVDGPATTAVDRVWHMDDPESVGQNITSSTIVARLVRRAIARRDDFDVILLDTPPVLATTDAIEYLQYADAAVMIVRIDQTPAPACELTSNILRRHGMVLPGVIVTDVPPTTIDQFQDTSG